MSLTLRSQELTGLNRAMSTLLSPLDYDTPEHWRQVANQEIRALLGADLATFLLPSRSGPWVYSEEGDPRVEEEYPNRMPRLPGGFSTWERQHYLKVWSRATLFAEYLDEFYQSAYYNEFAVPIRAFDTIGITIPFGGETAPGRFAGLIFHHDRPDGPKFGTKGLALLELLKPCFEAGVDAYRRLGPHREAITKVIDATGDAVLLVSQHRREVHRTPALERLLLNDPARDRLLVEMRGLAAAPPPGIREPSSLNTCTACVDTERGKYRMRLSFIEQAAPGGCRLAMVTLSRVAPPIPEVAPLRARFGLTKRQAEVACLLAEGKSNEEIAKTFFISPHTARHHTEQVLTKLAVSSRASVAARLHRQETVDIP
jgi:DNA-binding CsgD family transcriptional regulator